MNREDGLLAAVIARPDDDAPRLAYADWLDGRGDPRGTFIRTQLALEGLASDDPRRGDLARREAGLLAAHAREWAEPLGRRVEEWAFRRGFIERVATSLESPTSGLVPLLHQAPIRHLRDTNQFCDLDELVEALPHLGNLTGLEFWGLYAFDDEKLERILRSPSLYGLRTLILHHDRNGNLADDDLFVRWLAPTVDRRSYLPGFSPEIRVSNLRELAVNVDGCWRGPSTKVVRAMARSPYLAGLRKLNLSHARLDLGTVEEIGRSPHLARIEELDLGGCQLFGEVWDAILRWPQLARMRWLRLRGAMQTDSPGDGMRYLSEIPRYREAFDRAVPGLDWDTETIHPMVGGCWRGFRWEDDPGDSTGDRVQSDRPDPTGIVRNPDLYARLVKDYDSPGYAEDFLADLDAIEAVGREGVQPDPILLGAAIQAAQGYKQLVSPSVGDRNRPSVVVEYLLPSFGPAALPALLAGYDPKNSWESAGRLAAICRIDPLLGHRLCHEALPVADRTFQEVILDGLERVAPGEVEAVALEILERGFGMLATLPRDGSHVSNALKRLGPPSEATTARLMAALSHDNPKVRDAAARVLATLGPRAKAALPRLHAMLRAEGAQAYAALDALMVIDPRDEAGVPELVRGLQEPSYFYRFAMVRWLRTLGPVAGAAVPALIEALGDGHHFVRSEAAEALGAIGPAARPAVPALVDWLTGEADRIVQHAAVPFAEISDTTGRAAADALARIGETEDVAFFALVDALDAPNPRVRARALHTLKKSEAHLARIVPRLLAMVDDPDFHVRAAVLNLLLDYPLPKDELIQVCHAALRQNSPHFDRDAVFALDRLGPDVRAEVLAQHRDRQR